MDVATFSAGPRTATLSGFLTQSRASRRQAPARASYVRNPNPWPTPLYLHPRQRLARAMESVGRAGRLRPRDKQRGPRQHFRLHERLACESPGVVGRERARESGPSVSRARRARSVVSCGRRSPRSTGDVYRREEPPRYESGLRAHGSSQRFHRLRGHAVARALTTAPSLTDLSPPAARILIPQGWRRKGPPWTLSDKPSGCSTLCASVTKRRFPSESFTRGEPASSAEGGPTRSVKTVVVDFLEPLWFARQPLVK